MNFALKAITGEQTRARVLLRRELGRGPTKAEVDAIKKDVSLKTQVTLAQVMEDFNSGKEVVSSSFPDSSFVSLTVFLLSKWLPGV